MSEEEEKKRKRGKKRKKRKERKENQRKEKEKKERKEPQQKDIKEIYGALGIFCKSSSSLLVSLTESAYSLQVNENSIFLTAMSDIVYDFPFLFPISPFPFILEKVTQWCFIMLGDHAPFRAIMGPNGIDGFPNLGCVVSIRETLGLY